MQRATQFTRRKASGDRRSHFFCLFVSFLSWRIWPNSSAGIGGNPQGPLWVPLQRNTSGQATASWPPLCHWGMWGGGQRVLRPSWDCTQEKTYFPWLHPRMQYRDCFGNHRLCKFPGIKQKEQLTKERRKSPTDKRPFLPSTTLYDVSGKTT